MTGSRLALVAEDPSFAHAIAGYLKKLVGQSAFVCKFASIRSHLGPDTDGVLILAVTSSADAEEALRLANEITLQQWPPLLLLVLGEGVRCAKALEALEIQPGRLLRWPKDARLLTGLVQERTFAGRAFVEEEPASLGDKIARMLARSTPSLVPMAKQIALAAAHDVPVFVSGETGTGKTFLARLIHDMSTRRDHRFMVVPCGALVASLIESELFGHAKGAFTGADAVRIGKLAAVGEGTLLLDEIDALGIEQQANLLRVLETGEFEPVGSNQTHLCTARVIAASNQNVEEALLLGKIRTDLYYRLNVASLHLPPLRQRVQDIPPLARMMAARFNTRFRKHIFEIDSEALTALQAFPWPGNLRQLENVIMHAVLVSSGSTLKLENLPECIQEHVREDSLASEVKEELPQDPYLAERTALMRALSSCGYSRARAAHVLGISRVTLYKRLKKFGLMNAVQKG